MKYYKEASGVGRRFEFELDPGNVFIMFIDDEEGIKPEVYLNDMPISLKGKNRPEIDFFLDEPATVTIIDVGNEAQALERSVHVINFRGVPVFDHGHSIAVK